MAVASILIADDDRLIRTTLRTILEKADFTPMLASSGAGAIEIWRDRKPDLIILDVGMPGMDGLTACRALRALSDVPIMMLTGKDSEQDIVSGFEAGADDYIVKPFRGRELVARIHAILQRARRPAQPAENLLTYRDLSVDLDGQRVYRGDDVLALTTLEFRLLHYLMQRVGAVVEKEALFRDVWGYSLPAGGMNLIEVAVRRLREKVETGPSNPRYIQTVRGIGYRFGD